MSTPSPSYFSITGDQLIDGATTGYYWRLGPDRTIDWSISDGFGGEHWSNPSAVQTEVNSMLATYSYYANVKFNYVGYYQTPAGAYAAGSEINVSLDGNYFFTDSRVWARAFFPTPVENTYVGEAGDVYLNIRSQANYLSSYAPGSAGWMVFMHELGHALGLKHPHDDGGTGRPTLTELGLAGLDVDYATIMSYRDDFNWNLRQWDPATPMILDVLALQYLYGKNTATNAGDSLFSLTHNDMYTTYWDASGNDTVSAAKATEGWAILLPFLQPSTLVDTKAGVAAPIADFSLPSPHTLTWLAGDLENATGSAFADLLQGSNGPNSLFGNGGDDYITGLGGNDYIDGGLGRDTALLAGSISQYQVGRSGNGFTVSDKTGGTGNDTLFSIERIVFSDKTIDTAVKGVSATVAPSVLQSIVELYVAFFNRAPDSEGMEFWIGRAAAGVAVASIANTFYDAAIHYSSLTGYSVSMTNADFVNAIYHNVLGRTSADAGGLAFWSGALADGSQTRGTLVQSILDSAHTFKGNATYGWVADLLDNKFYVGKLFAIDLGLSLNTPEASITEGMRIAAAVTPTDTSVAISLIGVQAADIHLV